MGTTIQGWIEIEFSTCPGKWYAVVRLEPFVGIRDFIAEALFGYSRGPCILEPLAPDRGVPDDLSHIAAKEIEGKKIHEGYHNHTFILYSEIKKIDWKSIEKEIEEPIIWDDWGIVFKFLETLSLDPRLGPEHVRIITWLYS